MRTLSSSPCQLRLEVVLRYHSLKFLYMSSTINDVLPTLVPKLDISGANWVIFLLRFQIVGKRAVETL